MLTQPLKLKPGMTLTDIAHLRLHSQQLLASRYKTAPELVGWMGAMQAQDYPMVRWAMGTRLPGATSQIIQAAMDAGTLIRTHVLRPTWHVVAAKDIYWMLELTAPRIRASMKSRHKALGLTEEVIGKTLRLFEQALEGGRHLTRDALVAALQNAHVATQDNRASHLLMLGELTGLLCSGRSDGNKQTYALLEEWVPKTRPLLREEALAKLAHTYFSSHGPATLSDFVWWSGLTVTDARQGLEGARSGLQSSTLAGNTYWFDPALGKVKATHPSVFLLPAFDEYIISYKDRSAVLTEDHHKKAVSQNGIFWPVIIVQGQVAGTWKRSVEKEKVQLETHFFQSPTAPVQDAIEVAAQAYGKFLNKPIEIKHHIG